MPVPILGILGGVLPFVDKLFHTEEEKAAARLKLLEMAQQGDLAQMEVNLADAQSGSFWQAGWRPAVGWACAAAFVFAFLIQPFIWTVAFYTAEFGGYEIDLSGLPTLDLATMMPILIGMLGLGGLRTYEKAKGKA